MDTMSLGQAAGNSAACSTQYLLGLIIVYLLLVKSIGGGNGPGEKQLHAKHVKRKSPEAWRVSAGPSKGTLARSGSVLGVVRVWPGLSVNGTAAVGFLKNFSCLVSRRKDPEMLVHIGFGSSVTS